MSCGYDNKGTGAPTSVLLCSLYLVLRTVLFFIFLLFCLLRLCLLPFWILFLELALARLSPSLSLLVQVVRFHPSLDFPLLLALRLKTKDLLPFAGVPLASPPWACTFGTPVSFTRDGVVFCSFVFMGAVVFSKNPLSSLFRRLYVILMPSAIFLISLSILPLGAM